MNARTFEDELTATTVHTWLENDYYEVLGLPRDADARQITQAYRRLARANHPDINPAARPEDFHAVQRAHDVLGDEEQRLRYDEVHRAARHFASMRQRRQRPESDAWITGYSTRLQMQWYSYRAFNPWLSMYFGTTR